MLSDLRPQLSIGLWALRSRFPCLSRFPTFHWRTPEPPQTHCKPILRELGHRAISKVFRGSALEHGGDIRAPGQTDISAFENTVVWKRCMEAGLRRNGQKGRKAPPGVKDTATFVVRPLSSIRPGYQDSYATLEKEQGHVAKYPTQGPACSDEGHISDKHDGEGFAREEHNGECAATDKTKIARQRRSPTNSLLSRIDRDMQPPLASAINDKDTQQEGMAEGHGASMLAPVWPPNTPPNAFHITTFTPSPPTVVCVSEKNDVEQSFPDPPGSSGSWGNGLFDDNGSPIRAGRPDGRNYVPLLKNAGRTYQKFQPVPPFDAFKDRSSLPTPSVPSDEGESESPSSGSPLAGYGNTSAPSSKRRSYDGDYRSDAEKPSITGNNFASSESPQAPELLHHSGEHFRDEYTELYQNVSCERANQDIRPDTTNSKLDIPEFSPKDVPASSSNRQQKGDRDIGNWVTHPLLPEKAKPFKKRRGSAFEIDSELLRPSRKYRLYERPEDRPLEKDPSKQQSPAHSVHPLNSAKEFSSTVSPSSQSFHKTELGGFNATTSDEGPIHQSQNFAAQQEASSLKPFLDESLQKLSAIKHQQGSLLAPRQSLPDSTQGGWSIFSKDTPSQFPALDHDMGRSICHPVSPPPPFAHAGDVPLHHPKPQHLLPQLALGRFEDAALGIEKNGGNPWHTDQFDFPN